MPIIAFDANYCVWGIKKKTENIADMKYIPMVIDKFSLLTRNGYDIMLPIHVVSELLSNIPNKDERIRRFKEMENKFYIADFNSKASLILSDILNHHYSATNKQYQSQGISKKCLKYDALIVATAIAHDAECIYAHDSDFNTIANGFIDILKITDIPKSLIPTNNSGIFIDTEDDDAPF